MDYRTLASDAVNWVASDVTHVIGIVVVIAVIGVFNGIRNSLNHCSYTGHCGRRVL